MTDAAQRWSIAYENSNMAYPSEGLIRIFRGDFPTLPALGFARGKTLLDLGCGDARQVPLYLEKGLISAGVEISKKICDVAVSNAKRMGVDFECEVGHSGDIPWPDESFDFLVAWNSCYYMGFAETDFEEHVLEMRRVLRPGGWLIASVPMRTNFIFRGVDDSQERYVTIVDDYFGLRHGERMRRFIDRSDLEEGFSPSFTNMAIAESRSDWFGLSYDWFTLVASAK